MPSMLDSGYSELVGVPELPADGYAPYLDRIAQIQLFQTALLCMLIGLFLVRLYKR